MILEYLSYLIMIPSAVLCLLPMHSQLKYNIRQIFLILLSLSLVLLIAAGFTLLFSLASNTLFFVMIPFCYIGYHLLLDVPVCKSLAVFCAMFAWLSILSNFANGYDALQHPDSGADITTGSYVACQFVLVFLTIVLFAYPLWTFGNNIITQLDLHVIWYATIPVSLIFCIVNIGLRPRYYETLYVNRIFLTFWLSLSMMLLLYILLLVIFYFIVMSILKANRDKARIQFLEMKENQFNAQQQYIENTSRMRHDFRQNLRTLIELYQTGDYSTLEEYLKNYESSLPQNEIISFCKNNAFNALLNYYAHLAEQLSISLNLDINLPEKTQISDVDLCSMIGNILENAFYAAQGVDDGWIYLSVRPYYDNTLYIVATNSFDGHVRQKNGRYLSTRRKGNGIGLTSVISTAERYGGSASFSHDGNEFYSDIQIPLNEK